MPQPAFHAAHHAQILAVYVCASGARAAFETGGDFADAVDPPKPLPASPTMWEDLGALSEILPIDGAFYGHPEERSKRNLPWVEVILGPVSEGELLASANGDGYVDIDLQIRCRTQVDHDTYNGNLARFVGRAQALTLAHAARHVIERDLFTAARSYDPTHAFGLVGQMSRTLESIEIAPPSPHAQQNATVFDAITTLRVRQGQERPKP